MIKKKVTTLLFGFLIVASYTFMGGDCSTNDNDINIPISSVEPPASFTVKLQAEQGGDSEAIFNWTSSPDENNSSFEGYRIITVRLNEDEEIVSVIQVQALSKTARISKKSTVIAWSSTRTPLGNSCTKSLLFSKS